MALSCQAEPVALFLNIPNHRGRAIETLNEEIRLQLQDPTGDSNQDAHAIIMALQACNVYIPRHQAVNGDSGIFRREAVRFVKTKIMYWKRL